MTTDTQINPFVNRRLSGPSESFRSWTRLLWSWEEWGDPCNWADSHAGGTADTNIIVSFRPGFLILHIANSTNGAETFRLRSITQTKAPAYRQAGAASIIRMEDKNAIPVETGIQVLLPRKYGFLLSQE
jgi:hypothetical protein